MRHLLLLAALAIPALAAAPGARAQSSLADWQPPSRGMPAMPQMAELRGGWGAGAWQGAIAQVSGIGAEQTRAAGETSGGSARARFVRFTGGYRPAATWTDRNGDGTADLIEIFRDGARVVQLVDADYDGTANVLRVYSASGQLLRETQL